MGSKIFFLILLFSSFSFAAFKPVENLKFKVGPLEVTALNCLQDRERTLGSQVWATRKTSDFSIVIIDKPSYLNLREFRLRAFGPSQGGYFRNSNVYDATAIVTQGDDSLTLTDRLAPNTWVLKFDSNVTPEGDLIAQIKGVHIDLSLKMEYQLECSF